jgi:hypothetical protein
MSLLNDTASSNHAKQLKLGGDKLHEQTKMASALIEVTGKSLLA